MKRQVLWIGILLLLWTVINGVPAYVGGSSTEEFGTMVIRYFVGFWTLILAPGLIRLVSGTRKPSESTDRA